MLAALFAVQAFTTRGALVLDSRVAAVAVGVVLLWRRAPFWLVVLAAAVTGCSCSGGPACLTSTPVGFRECPPQTSPPAQPFPATRLRSRTSSSPRGARGWAMRPTPYPPTRSRPSGRRPSRRRPRRKHRVFVATDGPLVVGFAALAPTEIVALEVAPEHRRAGHGSRLLAACVDTLRINNASEVRAWSLEGDTVREAFLSGAGLGVGGVRRVLEGPTGDLPERIWVATL